MEREEAIMSDFPPYPGTPIKGTVHKRVEQLVNGNPQARDALLDALRNTTKDYVQILIDQANLTREEADHLRKTWYSSGCWWPAHHPMEPIVRQSLIKALELARPENLDIDSYWLCAGDEFQVMVTRNNQRVIRLILTPLPQCAPGQPQPVWIFKKGTVSQATFS